MVGFLRARTASVVVIAALCACSGGGGQGPTPAASPAATSTPVPTPSPVATATQATTVDDWPLDGHDAARSGVSNETGGSVGPLSLSELWQTKLGDIADSSPIEYNGMLYATVHGGTTYGISASSGKIVWTFTTSGTGITTSEPAYDTSADVLYAGGIDGKIHRLNPATGVEDTTHGFPATITIATKTEKDASPLNIANGYVYAQTSGYNGDAPPYVGHVVAVSTATGAVHVFNTLCASQTTIIDPATCGQSDSGLWSRSGPVVDPDAQMGGAVYASTGNGDYDPASGDYGDTMLELAPDMSSLEGYYAPGDALQLQQDDLDLGSTSPALIPRQSNSTTPLMAIQGGKDKLLRLVNRATLNASSVLQSITLDAMVFSAPAVYQSPGGTLYVYVGLPDGMYAYALMTMGGASQLSQVWKTSLTLGGEGTSAAVRDGVVYVAASNELVALDATTGATLGSATIGGVHWESPMIAHGVVYVTDENDDLTAFQIVPNATSSAKKKR